MSVEPAGPEVSAARFREVLLEYLLSTRAWTWPGTDGLTLKDVFNFTGGPAGPETWGNIDWQRFVREHPEWEAALRAWLARYGQPGPPP